MSRLIDADAHDCWACTHHNTGKCDTWCDHGEAFEMREDVANAPTVEAEPVRHEQWIYDDETAKWGYPYICSNPRCNKAHDFKEDYCPNCGAKMDKKEE